MFPSYSLCDWVSRPYRVCGQDKNTWEGRMRSLFIIVYLIETSLWVQDPVPTPPCCFVSTQRGKWPAASLFENCPAVKMAVTFSQCFPGLISSVPTPAASTVSPPLIPHCSLPPAGRMTATESNQSTCDPQMNGRSHILFLTFFFSYNLTLCSFVFATQQKTDLQTQPVPMLYPIKKMTSTARLRSFLNAITQMWFSEHLSDPEVKYAASGCIPHLPIFFSQRDVYFGNPILF